MLFPIPKVEGKFLLLKTPHTSDTESKGPELDLMKAPFLTTNFHSTRRHCGSFWKKGVIRTTDSEPQQQSAWHNEPKGNQDLSNWTQGPVNKRKIMPGSENLANYPGLVKSWIV